MADKKQLKEAVATYKALCDALDRRKWKYTKEEEKLMVRFNVSGDDLNMSFVMFVDADRALVRLMSWLPFNATNNPDAVSRAVLQANYKMIAGSFDFNYKDGAIAFRLSASYKGAVLGDGAFNYMINVAANTVDDYNDELLMLDKGQITIEQFMKKHA
ncbi:MAG: YbjN domain-containing protein [Clostridia bacterium]|nr:YbjN domain-containing protein [Clostridia bacterium]